jgi:hypothetical protein
LYFRAVGEAELCTGAATVPDSKRRDRLIAEIDAMTAEIAETASSTGCCGSPCWRRISKR